MWPVEIRGWETTWRPLANPSSQHQMQLRRWRIDAFRDDPDPDSSDGFTLEIARSSDGYSLTDEGHVIARRSAKMEMLLRRGLRLR
jgi:hypothetical protein